MTPQRFWGRVAAISRQLAAWALLSLAAGAAAAILGPPFWRAVGIQFLVWGAIDLAIAAAGARDLRRKLAAGAADDPAAAERERRRLRRLLLVNAGLDVGYLAVGAALTGFGAGPIRAGHGAGVLVQGAFLLAFDAGHAAGLRRPLSPPPG